MNESLQTHWSKALSESLREGAVAGSRREGLLKHKGHYTSSHFTKRHTQMYTHTHTHPFQLCRKPSKPIAKVTFDLHYKLTDSIPSSLQFDWLLIGAAYTALPSRTVLTHDFCKVTPHVQLTIKKTP